MLPEGVEHVTECRLLPRVGRGLLPRDLVKLDADLIAGIDRSRRKRSAVRSLVGMCRDLGAQVVAKGVDCEAELNCVKECGIEFGQGYALGPPARLPTTLRR